MLYGSMFPISFDASLRALMQSLEGWVPDPKSQLIPKVL